MAEVNVSSLCCSKIVCFGRFKVHSFASCEWNEQISGSLEGASKLNKRGRSELDSC